MLGLGWLFSGVGVGWLGCWLGLFSQGLGVGWWGSSARVRDRRGDAACWLGLLGPFSFTVGVFFLGILVVSSSSLQ